MREAFDGDEPAALAPSQLGVWSLRAGAWSSRTSVPGRLGTLLTCGERVVSLYGHPRLIDPMTGNMFAGRDEVDAGTRSGSYGVNHVPTPVATLDPAGRRLAIAQDGRIAVLDLGTP